MAVVAALALISPALGAEQMAQTPGPDLAWQHAVMQSEAFIISENSCIPTSRRARAGWHAGPAFHGIRFGNLTATEKLSRQLEPGRAIILPPNGTRQELKLQKLLLICISYRSSETSKKSSLAMVILFSQPRDLMSKSIYLTIIRDTIGLKFYILDCGCIYYQRVFTDGGLDPQIGIYRDAEDGPCEICLTQTRIWDNRVIDENVVYNSKFQTETV
jgi:hypothetical protein